MRIKLLHLQYEINTMDLMQTIPIPSRTQATNAAAPVVESKIATEIIPAVIKEAKADKVEISSSNENKKTPNISRWRFFFNRLSQKQIDQVNESRMLPKKGKFVKNIFKYKVANNWCNVTEGTPVLPAGYELRRSLWGFTKVRPIGTKGLFIRTTPQEKESKRLEKVEKAQAKAEAKAAKAEAKLAAKSEKA